MHTPSEAYPPVGGAGEIQGDALATWWHKNTLCSSYPPRPDLPTFYQPPFALTLDQWHMAMDSQAQAFLLGAQEAARLMPDGGRLIAVTYSPSGRMGS